MKIECRVEACLIGDSLCTIPFILHLAKNNEVYVTGDMPDSVRELCRGMPFLFIDAPPSVDKTYVLNCNQAWQWDNKNDWLYSMAQSYFGLYEFAIGGIQPISFCIHEVDLPPGIVISPFARSDGAFTKRWPVEKWQEFIELCKHRAPIYVLGSHEDDMEPFWTAGATPIQGWHLPSVLKLILTSKVFVSIDTGTSHLAGLAGFNRHVLIYPNGLPRNWAEYKTARVVKGATNHAISVESVYTAVKDFI